MKIFFRTSLLTLLIVFAPEAFAHHPLAGMPMQTFTHGLLSGIGHPVLGFDHLFFVIVVGITALCAGGRYLMPAAYIVAMAVGCLLMWRGVGLPTKELVIAISLLLMGGLLVLGQAVRIFYAVLLFVAFGVFHGSAFGESLIGNEGQMGTYVVVGYLIGLCLIQYAIAITAGWVLSNFFSVTSARSIEARLSGALVAGIGLFLSMEICESLIFDFMNWGT